MRSYGGTLFVISLVLCFIDRYTNGQRTPTISYITKPDITTRIGGTVEMECSVLYATEFPILWMKLPKDCEPRDNDIRSKVSDKCSAIPLSSESALIVRDNRFSMRYDTASSTYTIQIKDVQKTDEAIYQCQIIVGLNNKVTDHVAILVQEPPVIADNSTRLVSVAENTPAELICHAEGSPTPSVSWRRENNAILPTGGVLYRGNELKIHSVHKEDRGTYYCVADNGVGRPARRNVAVEVEFPPDVEAHTKVVEQALGYGVELVCNVVAYPPPTITWVHNGIQLSTNLNYIVDPGYTSDDDQTLTSVRVKNLKPRELGDYICKAQNKLGAGETTLTIRQSYTPNCVVGICEDYTSGSEKIKFLSNNYRCAISANFVFIIFYYAYFLRI